MDKKEMAELIDIDGLSSDIEVVTYLNSEDNKRQYVVYSKEEIQEQTGNQVIYIARIIPDENSFKLEEITDDIEWIDVQRLLKKIANAQSQVG